MGGFSSEAALFGITQTKIKTYVSSKKITSLFRVSITDSWPRNVYLVYFLSRGTVVILFLGNICLYFYVRLRRAANKESEQSLKQTGIIDGAAI